MREPVSVPAGTVISTFLPAGPSPEPADVELETARVRAGAARRSGCTAVRALASALATTAREAFEGPETAHLIVLFPLLGVADDGVRLGDLLEPLGRLRIVLIGVG